MLKRRGKYNPQMVAILESFQMAEVKREVIVKNIRISELKTGMVAYEDIRAKDGSVLVPKSQEVTYPVLERLRTFSLTVGIVEPFRVKLAPRQSSLPLTSLDPLSSIDII